MLSARPAIARPMTPWFISMNAGRVSSDVGGEGDDQDPFAAEAVAQLAGERDQDRGEQHGEQHDGGRGALGEAQDVGEVHGDVDGADVGADGLHGGDQDDLQQRCPVVREQVLDGLVVGVALGLGRDELGAVLDLQAQVQAQRAEREGEQERDPPAPGLHGRAGQGERDEGGDAGGQGLAELGDAGNEGDVQRAALGWCPFPDVAGGAADLTAGGEALQDPHQRPAGSAPRRRSARTRGAGR